MIFTDFFTFYEFWPTAKVPRGSFGCGQKVAKSYDCCTFLKHVAPDVRKKANMLVFCPFVRPWLGQLLGPWIGSWLGYLAFLRTPAIAGAYIIIIL